MFLKYRLLLSDKFVQDFMLLSTIIDERTVFCTLFL